MGKPNGRAEGGLGFRREEVRTVHLKPFGSNLKCGQEASTRMKDQLKRQRLNLKPEREYGRGNYEQRCTPHHASQYCGSQQKLEPRQQKARREGTSPVSSLPNVMSSSNSSAITL